MNRDGLDKNNLRLGALPDYGFVSTRSRQFDRERAL